MTKPAGKRASTGVVHSYLPIAKARRAKLRTPPAGTDASIEGIEPTPRYTQAEVDELGRRGLAFKKADGTFGWLIRDRRDLLNAIHDWPHARPTEAGAVKAWIKRRAVLLGLEDDLPAAWQTKVPRPVEGLSGQGGVPDSAPSVGGQPQ